MNQEKRPLRIWLGITLAAAILVRIALLVGYAPVPYGDSASYRRLSRSVLNHFERYDGTRTPGYPVFLAIVGSDERVWLVQMVMGLAITLLFFYIAWRLSGKAWLAGLAGLAHSLSLGQLFFEANLLTETLTTFLIILALAGVLLLQKGSPAKPPSPLLALTIGLFSALALITRPLFIYLPFIALFFILLAGLKPGTIKPLDPKRWLFNLLVFLVPVALILGGWVTFIHSRFGDWGLTTMTGYHLVQHTGGFFEYAPDEYAVIRDTYLRYRDAHIAQFGTQTNTIWDAIPELSKVSGLNFYDLSRTLAHISTGLILEHPELYLRNVLKGWWYFWFAPVYWSPEALRIPALAAPIQWLVNVQRILAAGFNLFFVITSLLWMFHEAKQFFIKRRTPAGTALANRGEAAQPTFAPFLWYLAASIWIASILQSMLDHGDNPRFLVPLQSTVILWGLWYLGQAAPHWIQNIKERRLFQKR